MNKLSLYRNILYSAKNLDSFQFDSLLNLFDAYSALFIEKNIEERRKSEDHELRRSYKKDTAHSGIFDVNEIYNLKNMLRLYKKESYFYKILNTKMRTFRTFKDFEKCCLPFFELYHTIELLYLQNIKEESKAEKPRGDLLVYRGCKMSDDEFKRLQ